jgi:signal transduction histidine kinase
VAREALANAAKHAGPDAHIGITISWLPEVVRVEVTSGSGSTTPMQASDLSGGYGLLSLQERVGLAGGELRWSADGNKFAVDARFPVAASDHQLANAAGE